MSRYLADIEALHTQKAGESLPSRLREQVKAATTPPQDEPEPHPNDAQAEEE